MKKIKKLVLTTGLYIIISTCGCSLQNQIENQKNDSTSIENEIQNISTTEPTIIDLSSITIIDFITPSPAPLPSPTPTLQPISSDVPEETIIIEDNRMLASLTFDDGPSKYTEELLLFLEEYNIKATFFVVGYNCEKYSDALSLIIEYGHEIAIHSKTHTDFTKQTITEIDNEIKYTIDYIKALELPVSELVRPPYGSINKEIKNNISYPFINWDIDTEDWKTRDKEQIKQEIINNIHEGAIILMHDHHSETVHKANIEALKEILPELTKEYKFVTITELSESFNVELENGKVYRKIIKNEN